MNVSRGNSLILILFKHETECGSNGVYAESNQEF
jgi:hypothetical protein